MSTTYAGNPNNYPATITQPSDGELRTASSVNVPDAALADRTAFLKKRSDLVTNVGFLNWPGAAYSASNAFTRACMAYDPTFGRFWIAGNAQANGSDPILASVEDYGAGISPPLGALAGADRMNGAQNGTGDYQSDVSCDATGGVVMSTRGRYAYQTPGQVNPSFTRVDVFGAAMTSPGGASLVFEKVTGRWVWMCNNSTSVVVRYSTNRTTWLAGGVPGWSTTTWLAFKVRARASGVVMAVAAAGSTIYVATSSDGGTSWTLRTNITSAAGLWANMPLGLVFDESSAVWLLTLPGTTSTELWSSPDNGGTWTKKATMTTATLGEVAPVGDGATLVGAIVGSSTSDQIVVSSDLGATWFRISLGFSGNNGASAQAIATPSGFAVIWSQNQGSSGAGTRALFSLRTGANALSSQVT